MQLEPNEVNPSDDLRALKQLFDHGWLSEADHQRLKQYIQDTCFGPNTPYYAKLQAAHQKKESAGKAPKKIYHRKRGPRGPQRCSVCHKYRKDHICDNMPCQSVEECGIERLHRYESFEENTALNNPAIVAAAKNEQPDTTLKEPIALPNEAPTMALPLIVPSPTPLVDQAGQPLTQPDFLVDGEPAAKRPRLDNDPNLSLGFDGNFSDLGQINFNQLSTMPDVDHPVQHGEESCSEYSDDIDEDTLGANMQKQHEIWAALHVFSQNVKIPCPAIADTAEVMVIGKDVQGDALFFKLDNGLSVDAFKVAPTGNSLEAKFNRKLLADYKQWTVFCRS